MQLRDVISVLEAIASTRLAEPWDNVGLLVGDPDRAASAALLCIDYTAEVAREARELGCDLVVAYHPPIFEAVKRVTAPSPVYQAIHDGIALYSPHTALDVAAGGTNDLLADIVGIAERAPLKRAAGKATQHKLVTFVPEAQVQAVSDALFAAGAGRIGNYTSVSFRSPGEGTFFGGPGAQPVVGASGRLERQSEVRLEVVVPANCTFAIVAALRAAHPYEEPAFDLVELAAVPPALGIGRIGRLPEPAPLGALLAQIKQGLGVASLLVAAPEGVTDESPIASAAVCAGACGNLLDDAIAQRADLYLTGEIRHHDALKATRAGLTVVCALHSNSERATLARVKAQLEQALPGLRVMLSARDRDPFAIR